MTGRKGNKKILKKGIVLVLIAVFGILLLNVFAEEERTRISDLEKEELSDEDNEALKEYYGSVFGIIGENSRFNNIATKDNIAIINVSIDGIDRRIITKLATGVVLPKIADKLVAALLQADNVTVFDYLRILGKTIFSSITSFGERNFYGIEGSEAKYVDEGFSRLINGKANVSINPVLRELISSYSVYLSAQGLTQGIYVSEKSSSYFVVKSVNSNSNVGFSWMLRGIKKAAESKLSSINGKELGIDIAATINSENGTTTVRINGLDKILELVNRYNEQTINNIAGNETNQNNTIDNSNETDNDPGIQLVTGNVIDEFGLETDLGGILSDSPQTLAEIGNINSNQDGATNNNPGIDETNNSPTGDNSMPNNAIDNQNDISNTNQTPANETDEPVLEFTLFTMDEGLIVNEISAVTGLSANDVRKLVTFVYADPVGFEDEIIEQGAGKIDGIEKINGSVIVRLG